MLARVRVVKRCHWPSFARCRGPRSAGYDLDTLSSGLLPKQTVTQSETPFQDVSSETGCNRRPGVTQPGTMRQQPLGQARSPLCIRHLQAEHRFAYCAQVSKGSMDTYCRRRRRSTAYIRRTCLPDAIFYARFISAGTNLKTYMVRRMPKSAL